MIPNRRKAVLAGMVAWTAMLNASMAFGQVLFFDDFEDRIQDQALIGNSWTWFDQTFNADDCSGDPFAEYGPWDEGPIDPVTGLPDDYVAENRNYYTASADVGQGDSYYRAGLEVPAWEGELSNMLRVYGNQFNMLPGCQRTLIFQEMTIENPGAFVFSFDVAKDQFGAPANGETIWAFVKILDPGNGWETQLFKVVEPQPPGGAGVVEQYIDFTILPEQVGMLLQFGFYNDLTPSLGHSWTTSGAYYDNVTLAPINIGPGHSGSFFNSGQNGHGFSVEFTELPDGTPIAIIYWYTFDNVGNNVFLVGLGTPVGNSVEVTFTSSLGMQYGVWNPVPNEEQLEAGTGVFEFLDRDNATFSYTPNEYAQAQFGHTTPVENLPLTKIIGIPANREFSNPLLP